LLKKGNCEVKVPERFETERLLLRRSMVEDAEAIFAGYAQDHEVTKYLTWKATGNIEDTREHLRTSATAWREGAVGVRVDGYKVELGYVLARRFWGKGYMTEAVRAVVSWALEEKDIYRVWAVCDVENQASARVMEKVGMQREGILRRWTMHPNRSDEPRDCYCYAMTK